MRIDPPAVFLHTMASVPLRMGLVWLAALAGSFSPLLLAEGMDAFEVLRWHAILLPFYLVIIARASGWWAFVAVPLVFVLAWRVLVYLRDDGFSLDLLWIFLLAFLISIRASAGAWPVAVVCAAVGIGLALRIKCRSTYPECR